MQTGPTDVAATTANDCSPSPGVPTQTNSHWLARERDIATWIDGIVDAGRAVTIKAAMTHFDAAYQTVKRLVERDVAAGRLVYLSRNRGYVRPGLAHRAATLETLVEAARSHTIEETAARGGRRNTSSQRDLTALTQAQAIKATTAAGAVAEALVGDRRALHAVGEEHFRWVDLGEGGGVWQLVERLDTILPAGRSPAVRMAHATGIRLLLDLGAGLGLIARAPQPRIDSETEPAEWTPIILSWKGPLDALGGSFNTRYGRVHGARVLARFAARRGWLDESAVDWDVVREDVEVARWVTRSLTREAYLSAKRSYRALQSLGHIGGLAWGRPRRGRTMIVPTALVQTAADTGKLDGWREASSLPEPQHAALLDGRYGFGDWLTWMDARVSDGDLARLGLPRREHHEPTVQQQRRRERREKKGQLVFGCRPSSLKRNLSLATAYAGAVAGDVGAEIERCGLVALTDPALFERQAKRWNEARGREPRARGGCLRNTASVLATMASPFLEARARQAGDHELAKSLRERGERLGVLAVRYEPTRAERASAAKRAGAWEADGGDGWMKLRGIVDLMVEDIERLGGGTIEEQIARVAAGVPFPRRARKALACLVRDASVFAVGRRVPLRENNLAQLEEGESWMTGRRPPWEGVIEIHCRRTKMGEPWDGYLIAPPYVGEPDAEADLRRPLLQLLLMPGGARDVLATRPDGTVIPTKLIFPKDVSTGDKGARRRGAVTAMLSTPGLAAMLQRRIQDYLGRLGLDVRHMTTIYGATGGHVLRHLLMVWANRNGMLAEGATLIGDSLSVATEHYAQLSPRTTHIDSMQRRAGRRLPESGIGLPRLVESGSSREPVQHSGTDPLGADAYAEALERLLDRRERGLLDAEEYDVLRARLRRRRDAAAAA